MWQLVPVNLVLWRLKQEERRLRDSLGHTQNKTKMGVGVRETAQSVKRLHKDLSSLPSTSIKSQP